MSIDHKYFPSDKNYLLKTVQAFSKEMLLKEWTDAAYSGYNQMENPLGLQDEFIGNLQENIHKGKTILNEGYDLLAALYRYKYGDNQLAFLWDGRTHMEFYDDTWKEVFRDWSKNLSQNPEVYRAVIKMAVSDHHMNVDFLQQSIRRTILKTYKLKLTKVNRQMSLTA